MSLKNLDYKAKSSGTFVKAFDNSHIAKRKPK